ncbi:hypothetical protein [Tenacibaculum amylolyticum]|uniref:hypothetical protein n=1 Tax=Tenacibaculum amylolyticum TaxID=104269 RepID=UPI0038933B98
MKLKKNTFILFMLLSIVLVGCSKTDWRENFRERSTDPFGTYILTEEAKLMFHNDDFIILKQHVYDYFIDIYYDYEPNFANYVCVKPSAYRLNEETTNKILEFVGAGNDAFFSLNHFNDYLSEALKFETENLDNEVYTIEALRALNGTLYLKNKKFKDTAFTFDRNIRKNYFSKIDSSHTTVLGTQEINGNQQPNFIKIKYQKGNIFLHTQPIAFTNFFLLNGKEDYAANVFSYLPNRTIIWDPQIRSSKFQNEKDTTSALNFFMKHPSLRWSLYIAFIGLLLFLFTNYRRKQRAIPEVKKLKNSTQDFTHTIANLYLKEENHKNIVSKKITYFLEQMRSKYHLETHNLNSDFIEKLAAKSGNSLHTTKYLINTIVALNKRSECTQDELVRLNTLIENFLQNK